MEKKCCICGSEFITAGNNAEPVRKGVCCETCNSKFIVPVRMLGSKFSDLHNFEVAKTHKEFQNITSALQTRHFEKVATVPFVSVYENIETEEKVVLCVV